MNKLKLLWTQLIGSFWFVPSLIVIFSGALAVGLIEADITGSKEWATRWPRVFGAGAAGARGMLSTIAGSMMTVVGVTFSMVLVTLALASSQYTSRILRNFMRDRVTQIVLGIFAGIFTYCLIVLRTIRGGDEGEFVPSLAVTLGVVLAIGGIGVLIFFLHHIASSIQASSIISSVAKETLVAVERLFPEKLGRGVEESANPAPPLPPERNWHAVASQRTGYIQNVDSAALLRFACEHKAIVRMERGIGEFVIQGGTIASITTGDSANKKLIGALQGAYSLGRYRTVEQDIGFGIRQLVDIALRALSPGINDTTTAVMCLDYLTAILARLATREFPSSLRIEAGQLRVIAIGPNFAALVAESFDQIRGSASGNIVILLRLLDALQTIASVTSGATRRRPLWEQMQWIAELGGRTIASPHERMRFESQLAQTRAAMGSPEAKE